MNKVGKITEEKADQPVINDFTWGNATIKHHPQDIDGMNDKDFIMAAKIEELID